MTARDRAAMVRRLHKAIPWMSSGHPQDQDQIIDACIGEVDRAVRVERKRSRVPGLVSPAAMEMAAEMRRKGRT